MNEFFLTGGIAVIILVLLCVAIIMRRKYPHPVDYYSFFWTGIFWAIIGIFFIILSENNYFFFIMGIIFAAVGFSHRDKWKKNRVKWKNLKKTERIVQIILIFLLAVITSAGLVFFLLNSEIAGIF